jgi:hypothetical protein
MLGTVQKVQLLVMTFLGFPRLILCAARRMTGPKSSILAQKIEQKIYPVAVI